jgi:iron complex transport system ATP-binding protein
MLAAQDLSLRLGGKAVLDGVSAELEPGRVTAIVGANGAGKSTLLACLAGLRRADTGTVRLGGQDVHALPSKERARRIGVLPQTPEVAWSIDARTLVGLGRIPHHGALGHDTADQQAIVRAMAVADVQSLAHRDVTTLSGGERTRVLIARVLAGEPDWILADEPLTGLDPGHQLDLVTVLRQLAQEGRGVVLTLHDLTVAARAADRILVMAHGRVLADGPPAEALSSSVLSAAYDVEARLFDGAAGPLVEILGRPR